MTIDATLTELIYDSSVRAFRHWRTANPTERVFAFALSTLDDAIYVNANVNSEESHRRRLAERNLEPDSAYGRETKWGPWEWENEYTGQVHFAPVDERLKQMYEHCADGEFGRFRTTVFDSMLQALLKLRENSIVTNNGDPTGIVMFATIYDSFDAESLHRKSAELLNAPDIISELISVIGG
ncbi:MAG: DUF4303 domain-containing protein [Planctomycetaceae bacterium]|nr:DUF4303 domain-containing protein [Planctomycetaceae bacterium]